ncbi:MAG: ribbon-helix-helix protein, CopG family [Gammaproteobacteria bacterium]|nr:ribbon-helix-helix protein, CopG family [Gammaproteobacteria bacterium]
MSREFVYRQISARILDSMVDAIDTAASKLRRSRAEVIRTALENFLEDFDDLSVALDRIRDPSDPVLDWEDVRRELLSTD